MKNLTTQITILTFLFLFPSISFSQTFKCEFIQEKFESGKSNGGTCSGDPEISMSSSLEPRSREKHCRYNSTSSNYTDYLDFNIDLDKKTISYHEVQGVPLHMMRERIKYHQRKGDKTEEEVRKSFDYLKKFSGDRKGEVLSVNTHLNRGMTDHPTIQYLIVYKEGYVPNEYIYSLFIPNNGKSILTWYSFVDKSSIGKSSWVDMKFGKCVNTSN
jgi:hypothetical protein